MHDNRYTQAVDGVKAPESLVEKMLETAKIVEAEENSRIRTDRSAADNRPKRRANRRVIRYAAAAALALVVALGAVFAPGLLGGKVGKGLVITVYAAELKKDSPVCISADSASMNIVGKNGGTEYYIELPVSLSSEHVANVTWSIDSDAIAVICPKDKDPVTVGNKVGEGFDTLFDARCAEQAEKSGAGDLTGSSLSRKYTSVTVDAAGQTDILAMAVAGTSSKNASEFYWQEDKENDSAADGDLLAQRAKRLNELLGRVIHCTVRFDDGSEQQIDIQLSFAVMKASIADPEAFAGLSAEEKEQKDNTGIFVVFSIEE